MRFIVQLWTTGNYHWYLKQSWEYPGDGAQPLYVGWDEIEENVMHTVLTDGAVSSATLDWTVCRNQLPHSNHEVAVIHGSKNSE